MERETIEKAVLTAAMAAWWLLLPVTGYTQGDAENLTAHLAYMWSHASFWHLAGNLFVLWIMRPKLHLAPSLLIAFVASYITAWSLYGDMGMTVGFSGVLFAIAGIKWGVYCRICRGTGLEAGRHAYWQFMTRALPFALIGIVIPHLNWCLHLYCMLAGFVYGRCR